MIGQRGIGNTLRTRSMPSLKVILASGTLLVSAAAGVWGAPKAFKAAHQEQSQTEDLKNAALGDIDAANRAMKLLDDPSHTVTPDLSTKQIRRTYTKLQRLELLNKRNGFSESRAIRADSILDSVFKEQGMT